MDHGSVYRRCGCRDESTGRLPGPALSRSRVVVLQRRPAVRGRAAAAVAAREALASPAAGSELGLSTGEWLHRWLASRVSLRASTARSYAAHVHGYLVPARWAKTGQSEARTPDGGNAVRLLGSATLALVTAGSAVSRTQTGFPAAR